MKAKVRAALTLLALFSLTLVVACSGSGSTPVATGTVDGSNGGATASSTPQNNAKSNDKMYDISFMSYAYNIFPPVEGPALNAIKEKFHANVHAQFIKYDDFNDKLNVLMASGDIPDVVEMVMPDQNYYKWAKQGAFLPIDEYIDQYPTLKLVPKSIYNQFKVDGHIYGIPTYSPTYTESLIVRKDWLDNLGLKMPTNYKELLDVAIAFTKDDPDKNGKNDTYGFALSANIYPDYNAGAYWSTAWYHKDKDGNYIPGVIGPGRKEVIQMLHDAYAQGAVTKDFAVVDWAHLNKEFYSGKAGICIGTPVGENEDFNLGLWKQHPEAKLASIPYFVAPDGTQGGHKGAGYFGYVTLSGKLKSDPGKVKKILEMMDYGRTFIPWEQRNPKNKQFDWLFGHEGVGYDMKDGKPVLRMGSEGVTPIQYLMQRHEFWKPWAPSDDANQFHNTYNTPEMQNYIKQIEDMEKTYNKNPYDDPAQGVFSETKATKGSDLDKYILGEQTKMISGQRPISDWDKMVQEWKDRGGDKVIKEINDGIKAKH
jgi:putative aldouronate transport system substrate-binding protein